MDPVAVTANTSGTTTSTTSTGTAKSTKTQHKSFSELFAEAEKDLKKGETLARVKGHEYARIHGGARNDMCVNLSGNPRTGEAFEVVTRGGRTFHVYGSGKDRMVFQVGGTHDAAPTGGTKAQPG